MQKRFGGLRTCLDDYKRLFAGVRDESAIGEGSVCYLWSPSAASSIASAIPSARIIIILMDPAERAFHQYLKSLSDRNVTHSFRAHLMKALKDGNDQLTIYHPFLSFGNYAEQVDRYKQRFPAEQIHLSLYEDFQRDYHGWFRSVLNFLEVDDTFTPQPVEIPSTPHFSRFHFLERRGRMDRFRSPLSKLIPQSLKLKLKDALRQEGEKPSLAQEDREILVNYYRENIIQLEGLIDRDLSAWLRV